MMSTNALSLSCARCSTPLTAGRGDFYVVSIIAVADPSPPVFLEEDLTRDVAREIRRLVRRMGSMDEQEAMDQVYRRKVLALCLPCYHEWIENPARR
jgi:hypothetical protein